MKYEMCQSCQKTIGMNDSFKIDGQILCESCLGQNPKSKDVDINSIRQVDPTICCNCKHDNKDNELAKMSNLPICPKCDDFYRNRPFPYWVKSAMMFVVAVVVLSLYFNAKYFNAYFNLISME
jgi:hypothetical protein